MKSRLLTIVWGKKHLSWFNRFCVASLAQPLNAAALRANVDVWDIVTKPEDALPAKLLADRLQLPVQVHALTQATVHPGEILQLELMNAMARCIEGKQALMIAPPDSIFADGTIDGLLAVGAPDLICVAVPHVRVTTNIEREADYAASPAALVGASWRHLHRTWVEAEATRKMTNTYAGGVSWRRIREGLYAVQHRLPTVYYAKLDITDLQWWQAWQAKDNRVGAWDHFWPSKLVAEERQRVIGCSDAGFIAEVTPEFANIPPVNAADLGEPDKCWGHGAHFLFNRCISAIFRAEVAPVGGERSP